MAAMAVRVGGSGAILLAKDAFYPAQVAFYLAHELGHLMLGHLAGDAAIIDLESTSVPAVRDDHEEYEADRFALELLTGRPDVTVLPSDRKYNAPGLAKAALDAGPQVGIEPGTLALCFGYATQSWAVTQAAMRFIYSEPKPVWKEVNTVAVSELDLDRLPDDSREFIDRVLGNQP